MLWRRKRTIGVEAVNEVCGGAGYWKVQKRW